jgi:hypothetical protein
LQGYIIRILQHFATKLWNITNFVMLFQAVMKYLSRSKFIVYNANVHCETQAACTCASLSFFKFRLSVLIIRFKSVRLF